MSIFIKIDISYLKKALGILEEMKTLKMKLLEKKRAVEKTSPAPNLQFYPYLYNLKINPA
jgi:hypothetical protein